MTQMAEVKEMKAYPKDFRMVRNIPFRVELDNKI